MVGGVGGGGVESGETPFLILDPWSSTNMIGVPQAVGHADHRDF